MKYVDNRLVYLCSLYRLRHAGDATESLRSAIKRYRRQQRKERRINGGRELNYWERDGWNKRYELSKRLSFIRSERKEQELREMRLFFHSRIAKKAV